MCNVTVPTNTVPSPSAFIPPDPADIDELVRSNNLIYQGEDAGGDVPPSLGRGGGRNNPPIEYIPPGDPASLTGTGFENLNSVLDQSLENGDDWAEFKSGPGNPYIADCYEICGWSRNTNDGNVPWCAGYVSFMLYQGGIESLRTLSSQAYLRYGTEIDWTDWSQVRINDIVVLTNRSDTSKGHVGFFRGYNRDRDQVIVLGGNQSDKVKLSTYAVNSSSRRLFVRSIKRNWAIPEEFDRPLYVNASGEPESYGQTR